VKFVVLKVEDIEKYCPFWQQEQLSEICNQIQGGRMEVGKEAENRYYIVNADEPYAEKVRALIEEHEDKKIKFD
jgi:hypothetical protein